MDPQPSGFRAFLFATVFYPRQDSLTSGYVHMRCVKGSMVG
jgi:hypothetical protein